MTKSPWENKEFARKNIAHIDTKFLPGTEQEVNFLEAEMKINKGSRIVDLGCGTGRHSITLAEKGFDVVGIDISSVLIKEAKKRATDAGIKLKFKTGDIRDIDKLLKEEDKFNGAICICESGFGTLGSEEEDFKFLKEVKQILKPEGKLILTTFNGIRRYRKYKEKDSVFNYLTGTVNWKAPRGEFGEELAEKTRVYIPAEAKMIFGLAGFRKVEILGCSPGNFSRKKLKIDDIEMMIIGIN